MSCKKTIKHRVCKDDYAWNPYVCACECDKHCEIEEYLKNCACVESIIDDLIITCNENVDMLEAVLISFLD